MNIQTFIKKAKKLGLKLGFMKFIGYEAIFSCAFRKRGSKDPQILLGHSEDFWFADPMIISRDGREIVFMERVNRHTGIGSIVCSDITDGEWTDPVPVIEESFHMSFPMCFEWADELYMIPESEMDKAVNLYRCVEFPYKWEHTARFLEGSRLVDTVITDKTDDKISCLTSEYLPENDFYTRFRRFELIRDTDGSFRAEDLGLIKEEYSLQSRMAGYPYIKNGHMVYPIQRSTSGVYGYSVIFMAEDPEDGERILELLPGDIKLDTKRKLIGVHTYSGTDMYEVIDVQYLARKVKKS